MGIYNTQTGRLGDILDKVYILFNDLKPGAKFLAETELLFWVNDCQEDIANDGYWSKVAIIGVEAGQDEYALSDLVEDRIIEIHNIRMVLTNNEVAIVTSWNAWADFQKVACERWPYILIHNDTLRISPTPTADDAAYLRIYYSYCPPKLGEEIEDEETNVTPLVPETRDDVFVYYCLAQGCLKDLGRRASQYQLFSAKYEEAKRRLLGAKMQLRRRLDPVR